MSDEQTYSSMTALQVAQAKLAIWLEADDALATGQEYSIDLSGTRRTLTRVDAGIVHKNIIYWQTRVNRLSGSGSAAPRVRNFIPLDR